VFRAVRGGFNLLSQDCKGISSTVFLSLAFSIYLLLFPLGLPSLNQ